MKKFLSFFLISFFILGYCNGQAGIEFSKDNWSEILKTAFNEDKLVFVDAYTSWCGPCKKMSKEIFPLKVVGDLYNENFVNAKIDMERGEGVAIAEKYEIVLYPTFLFLDSEGNIMHRATGFHNISQFMELGRAAADPSKRLSSYEKRYNEGERDPDFLLNYSQLRLDVMDGSHEAIAEEYMKTQDDWSTPENMDFVYNNLSSTNSGLFDHVVKNRDAFSERYGERLVTKKVMDIIYGAVQDTKEKSSLVQIDELFERAFPEQAAKMSAKYRLAYYRQAGDREKYAESAISYLSKFKSEATSDELNETAWTFYEVIDDKPKLKKAVKWAKQSMKMDNNYFNNDTLAALYYKLGKKKCATKAANKALAIGRTEGQDVSETEALLKRILGM